MTFKFYKLEESISQALEAMGYNSPTEVQKRALPDLLKGEDIIVKSETGSGKTAAFAVPICQEIDWDENAPQALILAPTRELAIQIKEEIFNIGRFKRIKAVAIYGKFPFERQRKELKQKNHIIVATPGRLLDHIERETIDLSKIRFFVIDEADELLRMGFIEQVEEILKCLPKSRQTALFSATMPEEIKSICEQYMNQPQFIEIEKPEREVVNIEQYGVSLEEEDKFEKLLSILIKEKPESVMVFCNTRYQVDDVYNALKRKISFCAKLHGEMMQKDRTQIMKAFKQGKYKLLVTTDVSARGIDIEKMDLVINYDLPLKTETYIHRIGRTGRIGNQGKAFSLITDEDENFIDDLKQLQIEELIAYELPTPEELKALEASFLEKWQEVPEIKNQKTELLNANIIKIHINAGRKTKMRPVDIVGTLCSIEGVTAEDIGIINILDVSTFVEILNGKGNEVLAVLQEKPIKGRIRKVTLKLED